MSKKQKLSRVQRELVEKMAALFRRRSLPSPYSREVEEFRRALREERKMTPAKLDRVAI